MSGSASLNKVELIGNLGRDPEVHESSTDGKKVVAITIATSDYWTDGGRPKKRTQWHQCVAFGRVAEICEEYLKQGSHVYIAGALMNVKWVTADGKKRSGSRVRIDQVKMLDKKEGAEINMPDNVADPELEAEYGEE